MNAAPATWSLKLGLFVVVGVLFTAIYGGIGSFQATNSTLHMVPSPVDGWVPFSAPWVVLYLFLIPQIFSPVFIIEKRPLLLRAALAFSLLILAGTPFWALYPVTVPRADVPVVDLWTYGVALTRMIDPPTNCLPSMHVAEACFSALLVRRLDRPIGNILLGTTVLIWYSTLALDQHWFADGVLGIAMAFAVDQLAYRGLDPAVFVSKPRVWHLGWLGLFVALFLAAASGWWLGWALPYLDTPMWR
ncbi:MAG: phosphatase PAP2 family protein [Proteobacteria bacterium]|nr:phosphatase PAP2 family protein [Pseudomonadota bacterium]MCP4915780.1 phosphatase PAP2 family protein [Pseudomonadota bacterium]